MSGWPKARDRFATPTYSIEIHRGFRECVTVHYSESGAVYDFPGEMVGDKWEQVNVSAPQDLADPDCSRIVRNVADGLTTLEYEFVIFKMGIPVPIPEEERQAALAGLRDMGWETVLEPDGRTLKLEKLPHYVPPLQSQSREAATRMMQYVSSARPSRAPIEILAKSKSAITRFL